MTTHPPSLRDLPARDLPGRDLGVRVLGDGLTGLAVAARLARWGHRIELVRTSRPTHTTPAHKSPAHKTPAPDPTPDGATTLPAAWRDLAKKTGQPLAGMLNAAHLELVEAPPETHHFADGTACALPTDRGAQLRTLEPLVGRTQARAWTALLDGADGLWQALRHNGVERPYSPTAPTTALLPTRTMADLADAHRVTDPRLLHLWFTAATRAGATRPETAPALLASRWSLERTFGRWHLVDSRSGLVQPLTRLDDLFRLRLEEFGVRPIDHPTDRPAAAEVDTRTPEPPAATLTDRLTRRATPRPLPTGGWTIDSFRAWQRRPPLRVDGSHWRGSPASHAGNEPWAQLLTGALIAYEVHEALTGQDIRPTNRQAPSPPRLRPLPRSADDLDADVSRAPE